jgi:hypothetical protein
VPQPSPATLLDSFRWYVGKGASFRYDLKAMPYELSCRLADTRLSVAERQWAVKNYANNPNPGKCYFDLKYDYDHFRKGEPKKISKLEYTLPNLRKVGGVCIEQAYYAAEVCKAMGMPAAIVTGKAGNGMGHAWLACLKMKGKEVGWDCQTGRYESMKFFTGELAEPLTGETVLDSELTLGGAAALLPLPRREEADAATVLAALAAGAVHDATPVDSAALKEFAADYNERHGKEKRAEIHWADSPGKIESKTVEDLLAAALERNLAHGPAWDMIVAMRKDDSLPVGHLDRYFEVLLDKTAKEFPDYSYVMIMQIAPTLTDLELRGKVYARAMSVYGRRQDLCGRMLLAIGDTFKEADKKDKALAAYNQAASQCADVADIVMPASAKAEELMRAAGDRGRDAAINLYSRLFGMTHADDSAFREETSHYMLGSKLADLLAEAGKDAEAKKVLAKIGADKSGLDKKP